MIPNLRVFENFFLLAPQLSYRFGFLRSAWLRKAWREVNARYGLECDPDAFVADLPFDQRQMLEIARALELPRMLGADCSVLLLDEPTTALSYTGVERLMQILHSARDSQTAIVFVSHRLVENLSLADRLLVLRDGALVAERPPRGTTEKDLHRLMVGRDRSDDYYHDNLRGKIQNARVLDLADLSGDGFHHVRLSVRAGEIIGIAGLASSGKSELCEAVHGLRRITSGEVRVCGKDMTGKSVEAQSGAGRRVRAEGEARRRDHRIGLNSIQRRPATIAAPVLRRSCRGVPCCRERDGSTPRQSRIGRNAAQVSFRGQPAKGGAREVDGQ